MKRTREKPYPDRFGQWYRSLFTEAPVMYVVTDEEAGVPFVVACNNLFARTLGYERPDVIGSALTTFLVGEVDDMRSLDPLAKETDLRARDGRVFHTLMRAVPEIDQEGHASGRRVTFVDITELRRSKMALRESEETHRALLDAIPDRLIRISRSAGKLVFEPARQTRTDLDPGNDIEARHRTLPEALVRQFERPFELARLGVTPTVSYQLQLDLEARHLEARLVGHGPNEVLAIVRDVTARVEIERQVLESQRLEALGRLAGGISHDFNNLLTVIAGNAELALMDHEFGDPAHAEIEEIVAAARRASELTRQLLAFSSKQILEPTAVDVNKLLSGMERMLRRLIGEDIAIDVQLDRGLGGILADPAQIEQVVMNLAVNSRDAMPKGGTLFIQTESCDLYETHVGQDLRIPSGRYVRLTVSDTGDGIDAEARSHIFEPFFTTKEEGKGTGLGLSTVYGIVKQSGGHIWVYSEIGKGTVFKLYFPRYDVVAPELPDVSKTTVPSDSKGETVLLVEDDAGVLDLAHAILRRSGYNVITAQNGPRALKIAADYRDNIALVATDVVMPGMSGRDLADGLEEIRPGLKVLYMSGYTDETIVRYGVREPGTHFLEKPYSSVALLQAVRQAIDTELTAAM